MRRLRHISVLATAALLLTACEAANLIDPGPGGPIDVEGVTVSAPSTDVGTGATLQLTAAATPAGASSSVTWASADDTRLTVSATGLVTAALTPLMAGTVRITATSTENTSISGGIDLTIVCGPLTSAAVSSGGTLPEDTCYIAESALSVSDGTLVIEPGVQINFGTSGSLSIGANGRLDAMGTMAKGITLTSTDPLGTWRGLRFNDSRSADNALHYVTIENGGNDGWSGATQSASALLLQGNSLVDIQNSTIRGSASRGITLYADAEMTFEQNTLEGNVVPAWMHPNTVQYLDTNSVIDGNDEDVVRVGYGNNDRVSSDQTWPNTGVPYEMQERMFIEAALVIDPGVTMMALSGVSMIVTNGGSVTAEGTAMDPITFEGSEDVRGAWKGLQIMTQSTDNVFDYVIFANGGSDPWTGGTDPRATVYMGSSSSAEFANTTFSGSDHYGLWVPAGGNITGFDSNTFRDNALTMRVHPNRAGDIAGNTVFDDNDEQSVRVTFGNNDAVLVAQTWDALTVPWRVMDRTFVRAPLTIEAGAELEFAQSANLVVTDAGTINAVGTVTDRIVFRGTQALAGYWKGIQVATLSAANRIEFADFMHAGSDAWFGGNDSASTLHVTGDGSMVLDNVTFGLTTGYAAIVSNGGSLSCTDTDDGGFLYYVYSSGGNGSQPTCPG